MEIEVEVGKLIEAVEMLKNKCEDFQAEIYELQTKVEAAKLSEQEEIGKILERIKELEEIAVSEEMEEVEEIEEASEEIIKEEKIEENTETIIEEKTAPPIRRRIGGLI